MSLRSGFAAVLVTLLLVVGSSAALCQINCVLPERSHQCCGTHGNAGAPSLARPQACTHAVRLIAAPPVVAVAVAQAATTKSLPPTPVFVAAAPVSQSAVETASPPKFNLRI